MGHAVRAAYMYAAMTDVAALTGENGYKAAEDIIPALREGLARLKGSPDKYRQYNSSNGWGTYKNFVPFVAKVLDACEKYPKAIIEVNV